MFSNLKESYKILDVFFSRKALLLKPHTSQLYNRMGLITLSNRSSRHFIDSLYILPIFKTSYIAFSASSARRFLVKLKFPVLVKIIPR
jgi:hypothetical protein